jgi:hypothetical protein
VLTQRSHDRHRPPQYLVESIAGVLFRQLGWHRDAPAGGPANLSAAAAPTDATPDAVGGAKPEAHEERLRKLVYFESLFYRVDINGNQFVEADEIERLFSFCAVHVDAAERRSIFESYDTSKDGRLNRIEFCELCVEHLWHVPSDVLEMMVGNMLKAADVRKARNRVYWSAVADAIERKSRIVVPVAYAFALVVLFNVDLKDQYLEPAEDGSIVEMFSGITPHSALTAAGIWIVPAFVAAVAIAVTSTELIHRKARKRIDAQTAREKEAARNLAHQVVVDQSFNRVSRASVRLSAMHTGVLATDSARTKATPRRV